MSQIFSCKTVLTYLPNIAVVQNRETEFRRARCKLSVRDKCGCTEILIIRSYVPSYFCMRCLKLCVKTKEASTRPLKAQDTAKLANSMAFFLVVARLNFFVAGLKLALSRFKLGCT